MQRLMMCLVDHSELGAGWATETVRVTETDTPQIERISIPLHELVCLAKSVAASAG